MGKLKSKDFTDAGLTAKSGESFDRVVLKKDEGTKLGRWLNQLNEKYDGLVKFSKSDLANFLIRQHEYELTEAEMNLIGAELYDELRWINRAVEKVRQAKRAGQNLNLEDLMMRRKPIEKIKVSLLKRERTQRKPDENEILYSENQVDDTLLKTPES